MLEQGKLEYAEKHTLQALAGSNRLNMDRRGRGLILANLGEVYLRRGDLSKADEYLAQALQAAESINERVVVANVNVLLGQLDERQASPALAHHHFDAGIPIHDELGIPDRLPDAHIQYADLRK